MGAKSRDAMAGLFAAAVVGGLGLAGALGQADAPKAAVSPQERIEQVKAAEKAFAGEDPSQPRRKVKVSGQVKTWDEMPLPEDMRLSIHSESGVSSSSTSMGVGRDGRFSTEIESGRITVIVMAEGYGTRKVGPIASAELKPLDIVLGEEIPVPVRFVDQEGRPVAGVKAEVWTVNGSSASGGPTITADANGKAMVRGGDLPLRLECIAKGFAYRRVEIPAKAEAEQLVTLVPAKPVSGRVVDAKGNGVPGAVVRVMGRGGGMSYYENSKNMEQVATADAEGRFVIDTFADQTPHVLWAEAPGFSPEMVKNVMASQKDVAVELGAVRRAKGKVLGDTKDLQKDYRTGQPQIGYWLEFRDQSTSHSYGQRVGVRKTAGAGEFELSNLPPCILRFDAEAKPHELDLCQRGATGEVLIDLRPADVRAAEAPKVKMRQVVVHLEAGAGHPAPKGTMHLAWNPKGDMRWQQKDLPLDEKGEASVDVPVGSTFDFRAVDVPGYAIPEKVFQVEEGEGAYRADVKVWPAGTIVGRALDEAGQPLERANVSLSTTKEPESQPDGAVSPQGRLRYDGTGKFAVSPIPLGGEYQVLISSTSINDHRVAVSEPLKLDDASPVREVTLKCGAPRDVEVELVDEQGHPAQTKLAMSYDMESGHGGCSGAMQPADPEGRFTFHQVTWPKGLVRRIDVEPGERTAGLVRPLKEGETKVRIVLPAGRTVSGQLVNASTGKPVVNCKLSVWRPMAKAGTYGRGSETTTDANGRFTFTGLDADVYALRADSCDPADARYSRTPEGLLQTMYPGGINLQIDTTRADAGVIKVQQRPER